jgi:hypothetical protein
MMTKVATKTKSKIAVAIAVVSVAGIVAAGFGFKFGINNTAATFKLKSPAANSTILASDKLEITWNTNVPSGKGLVDVYITKDGVTAPYDSQYNPITVIPGSPTILWHAYGVDASKKFISDPKFKTGADILKLKPSAIVPGTDTAYKVWLVLKKQPLKKENTVLTAEATVKLSYGGIKSLDVSFGTGAGQYWGDKIPFKVGYNFPEKGKMTVSLKNNANSLNYANNSINYPIKPLYTKNTEIGAGEYAGEIYLENATLFPAGEYILAVSWIANSCAGNTACPNKQEITDSGIKGVFTIGAAPSFKISGMVIYDENGNGLSDVGEDTYISSGKSCGKSIKNISVPGTKIMVKNNKTGKTDTYNLNICGGESSGKYMGEGVYYETIGYPQGADLTFTLLPGKGWKSTWPNPVGYKVTSENFIDFAMAKK